MYLVDEIELQACQSAASHQRERAVQWCTERRMQCMVAMGRHLPRQPPSIEWSFSAVVLP